MTAPVNCVCPKCLDWKIEGVKAMATIPDNRTDLTILCLGIAAEKFDEDAKVAMSAGQPHMAQQFERQAKEARELQFQIEEQG